MEKSCDFVLGTPDALITEALKVAQEVETTLDRRFTQEEDFFLVLNHPFIVESFEIHHDVSNPVASNRYRQVILSLLHEWTAQVPAIFHGLSWYFDPKNLFHPLFVQILSARNHYYLFVLRPDLTFRGQHAEVLEKGSNATTSRYQTSSLFLESELLPLQGWESAGGEKRLYLKKLFTSTWMGESGRGYFSTGRWIDHEITRLLSKSAFPPGVKTFPHYPLRCRHQTLSVPCLTPTSQGRKKAASILERAWPLVEPWAVQIETEMKEHSFHDTHDLIAQLRNAWGQGISTLWGDFVLEPYLNSHDQKEYQYNER